MTASSDIVFLHPKYSDLPDGLKGLIFDPDALRQAGLITKELKGRGSTYFFQLADHPCVLRHYWRGGYMRTVSRDGYLWLGLTRTRSYREWQLLEIMENLCLPCPRRVALRIQRMGLLYRSDIVTEEIQGINTLPELLGNRELTEAEWRRVGGTIRRFHNHAIFHQDLNANNLLLGAGSCYLIDFDRGRILEGNWWKGRVLNRLKHSLEKLSGQGLEFHFNPGSWMYFMDGYQADEETR